MASQSHANDDAQIDDEWTRNRKRAAREVENLELDMEADAEGDHVAHFVSHVDGSADVWVITEGLDTFVVNMFGKAFYEVVGFNGQRVTCAFKRRFDADH